MTFEEAFKHLQDGEIEHVAKEMIGWHPVVLGQMLLAVQVAKEVGSSYPHPDYWVALQTVQDRTVEPKQAMARYSPKMAAMSIAMAVRILRKRT